MRGAPCPTHGACPDTGDHEAYGAEEMCACMPLGKSSAPEDEGPVVNVRSPTGDGVVNDGGSDEDEDHKGIEFAVLCDSADGDDRAKEPEGERERARVGAKT